MPISTPASPSPADVEKPRPSLWRRWVLQPIINQLTQGTSPRQIALALAYGLAIGIFPIIGSTTLVALAIGIPLKLNQPILQVFKSLMGPLQWALILGFYRLGEKLFSAPPVPLSIPTMTEKFMAAPIPFFQEYGMTALYGITVWCLVAPFIVFLTYFLICPLIETMAKGLSSSNRTAPRKNSDDS